MIIRHAHTTLMLTVAAMVGVAGLAGCRGDRSDKPPRQFFPDMDDQPRFNPQSETQFFADGRTMRQPVEGTVAFGVSPAIIEADWNEHALRERAKLLKEDDRVFRGRNPDGGDYLTRFPVEVTPELLTRGAERFGIFCAVCHGYQGEGATQDTGGMAGRYWLAPVPGLHTEQYLAGGEKGQVGYLFEVVREGVWGPDGANRMPGYAHAVDEYDAWAIVAHVRALQETRRGTIDQLPEADRRRLQASVGPAASPVNSTEQPSSTPAQEATPAPTPGDDA